MAKAKAKFEESLARLEKIVAELEGADLTLDEMLARYEEGVKALRSCYEVLREAEKRVEALVAREDGTTSTRPFAAPDEPEEGPKEP